MISDLSTMEAKKSRQETCRSISAKYVAQLRKDGRTLADIDQLSTTTFKTLSRFPEINAQWCIPVIEKKITQELRLNPANLGHTNKISGSKSRTTATTTRKLFELKKSSYDDFTELKSYREELLRGRARYRSEMLALNQKLINGNFADVKNESDHQIIKGNKEIKPRIKILETAKEKIRIFSQSFDPKSPTNIITIHNGFHGARLFRTEFKVQIRRCLNMAHPLTNEELNVLFDSLGVDHEDTIDGVEFTRLFFSLGHQARQDVNIKALHNLIEQQNMLKKKHDEDDEK